MMTKKENPFNPAPSTLILIVGVIAALLLTACKFGLDPVDDESGSVTIALATIPGYAASSADAGTGNRAVIQGGGYLYIRPLGGPDGTGAKRYYGPYQIKAQSSGYELFKTADIPGGSYTGLAVLFAASPIDAVAVTLPAGETTLGAVFSLPDADFIAAVTSDLRDGLTALDITLDDSASFAIMGPTTIKPNAVTNLSVTLVPATNKVVSAVSGGGVSYAARGTHRAFVRVRKLTDLFGASGTAGAGLSVTVGNPDGETATVRTVAAYRADGSYIQDSAVPAATLPSGGTVPMGVTWDGGDQCYLYVEFDGTGLNFSFEPTGSSRALSVSFAGDAAQANRRAFFAVYDSSSVSYDANSGEYSPTGNPVALGTALLDASGSGTGTACAPNTATPYSPAPGTYYVSCFIDVNNNYADVTSSAGIGAVNDIVPHFDDLVSVQRTTPITVSAVSKAYPFDTAAFIHCTDHVFFVSQNGAGDGQRGGRPRAVNEVCSLFGDAIGATYHLYLMEDVTRSSDITVKTDCGLAIFSADAGQRSLTLTEGARVNVDGGGTLYLENAGIDGNGETRGYPLAVVAGTLILDAGSFLRNSICNDGQGGAVTVDNGGVFEFREGTISGCSAPSGGAVNVGDAGSFAFKGGTISGCAASDGSGGALYAQGSDNAASVSMLGGTISGCTAGSGGAVYIGSMGQFAFTGGRIQNCEATNPGFQGGGGVSLGMGGFMKLSGGVIAACKASGPEDAAGGGILLNFGATLTIESGSVTQCDATIGDGVAYYSSDQITDEKGVQNSVVSGNNGVDIQQIPN